jgi:hypothetical protein
MCPFGKLPPAAESQAVNVRPDGDDTSKLLGIRAMQKLRCCVIFGIFALLGVGTGCWRRPTQLKADTFVGEYVFHWGDSGSADHTPDRLILRADGTFAMVHMTGGHPVPTQEGTWELWNNLGQPEVAIGKRGYPVEIRGKCIRLIFDDDLDYYYEKTK